MKTFFQKLKNILLMIVQIPLNLILYLLYFILILPYHLIYKNSFKTDKTPGSFWLDIKSNNSGIEDLRRQF